MMGMLDLVFQDINKCLMALDQLSMVYVTSKHVQRHSELIVTLRKVKKAATRSRSVWRRISRLTCKPSSSSVPLKLRYYRANQSIMDKASMLYNRFKNTYLVGEGEEVVSTGFLRSLLEEKEREEAARCGETPLGEELLREAKKHTGHVSGGGGEEEEGQRAGATEGR